MFLNYYKPVEGSIGGLSNAGVVSTVRRGSHVVDHAHQLVLHRDVLAGGPPHVVGDVQLPAQSHGSPVLASHHVEPLQLDAEHHGWPLDLVLLGGGNLLVTLLTLVHVLSLTQVLSSEVSRQSSLDVVRLSDVEQEVHEVLEGGGDVFAPQTRHVLPHVAPEDLVEGGGLLGVVINILGNFS